LVTGSHVAPVACGVAQHIPERQEGDGELHAFLQLPQWAESDEVSVQPTLLFCPLQSVKPLLQVNEHFPLLHVPVAFGGAQVAPQAPQFAASEPVSTHFDWPGHATLVPGQTHAPIEHVASLGHALPQAPQFCLSLCVSTHSLPQTFGMVGGHTQEPPSHDAPPAHA
jgi:hypothetical protein